MVRAIVSDGITIGHPCCSVAHCTEPLENIKRDRFCPEHQYRLKICAVDQCKNKIEKGYLTCSNKEHCKLEDTRKQRNAANFQLQPQLQQMTVSVPPNEELTQACQAENQAIDKGVEESLCPQKPDSGIHRVTAHFGCRQTHDKQLMVRPCGMIIACTTFFGSETTPQAVVRLID